MIKQYHIEKILFFTSDYVIYCSNLVIRLGNDPDADSDSNQIIYTYEGVVPHEILVIDEIPVNLLGRFLVIRSNVTSPHLGIAGIQVITKETFQIN